MALNKETETKTVGWYHNRLLFCWVSDGLSSDGRWEAEKHISPQVIEPLFLIIFI